MLEKSYGCVDFPCLSCAGEVSNIRNMHRVALRFEFGRSNQIPQAGSPGEVCPANSSGG